MQFYQIKLCHHLLQHHLELSVCTVATRWAQPQKRNPAILQQWLKVFHCIHTAGTTMKKSCLGCGMIGKH